MIRPELNEYSIAKGVRAFSSTRRASQEASASGVKQASAAI